MRKDKRLPHELNAKTNRRIDEIERKFEDFRIKVAVSVACVGWTLVWGSLIYEILAPLLVETRHFSVTYSPGIGYQQLIVWFFGMLLVYLGHYKIR